MRLTSEAQPPFPPVPPRPPLITKSQFGAPRARAHPAPLTVSGGLTAGPRSGEGFNNFGAGGALLLLLLLVLVLLLLLREPPPPRPLWQLVQGAGGCGTPPKMDDFFAPSPDCRTSNAFLGGDGLVCNGHGSCVSVTVTGATNTNTTTTMCVCADGYTGAADMFTARGFSCANPVWLDRSVWIIAAALWTGLFIRAARPFARHVRSYLAMRADKKKWLARSVVARREATTLFVGHVVQYLVVVPCIVVTSVMRAAGAGNIGVDAPVTAVISVFFTWRSSPRTKSSPTSCSNRS